MSEKITVVYQDVDDLRKTMELEIGKPYVEYKRDLEKYLEIYISKIQLFTFKLTEASPMFDNNTCTKYVYVGLLDEYGNFKSFCTNVKINHFSDNNKHNTARIKNKYLIRNHDELNSCQASLCLTDSNGKYPIITDLKNTRVLVSTDTEILSEDFICYAKKDSCCSILDIIMKLPIVYDNKTNIRKLLKKNIKKLLRMHIAQKHRSYPIPIEEKEKIFYRYLLNEYSNIVEELLP